MQAAGTRIGRYELLEKLGEGGMAEVWKGRNVSIGLVVAIKVLLKHFAHDNDLQQRFLNEGRIQARLRHPNIVSVFDAYSEDGTSYLVMDFVEGETLESRLRNHAGRPLPVSEVLSISYDILAALEYAHTLPDGPIVHRDVKPSNILLDKDGRARLADFGIAVALNEDRKTKVGLAPGSIHYMSPEQIQTPRSIDRRSDIYSFGCVLYEMLTGDPPFVSDTDSDFKVHQAHVYQQPEPLRKRNPQVLFEFEWIVLKALNKDRETRFSSAKEMATVLKEAAAKGSLEARAAEPAAKVVPEKRATQVEESTPPKRRKIPWRPVVAALAVLVAAGMLWAFWPRSSSGTTTPNTPATAFEIDSVKFFPYSGTKVPDATGRKYQSDFRAGRTGIGWELSFKGAKETDIEAHWYLGDSEQTGCSTKDHLALWDAYLGGLSRGCEGNWAAGSYRVDFIADGKKIGSGEFTIDPAPVAGNRPASNAPASEYPAAGNSPPPAQPSDLETFLLGTWREERSSYESQTEYESGGTFDELHSFGVGAPLSFSGQWQVRSDGLWKIYTSCPPDACISSQLTWSKYNVKIIDHSHLATQFNPYDGTPLTIAQRMISY